MTERRSKLPSPDLGQSLRSLLRLPDRTGVPEFRILRTIARRGYPLPDATPYAVETESGVFAVVYRLSTEALLSRPPRDVRRAILYVSHHSADAELRGEPLLAELIKAEPESTFFACDVRGVGESRPDTCGVDQFLKPYGSDYFYAIHGVMLDRPYVGQKTLDVLRVLDWLHAHGHREVHLVARGWGTVPATFAAVLHDSVKQVTLKSPPTSFRDLAESETYSWPLSAFVPGVLAEFDLPDCYRMLEAKKLRQIEPG